MIWATGMASNAPGMPSSIPYQNSDEDHQSIELDGVAVNHRLEDAALHLLVDHDVDEQHHCLPWCDEQAHDDEQSPSQCCADQRYEVEHRNQECQRAA